jgi:hypothetical protein
MCCCPQPTASRAMRIWDLERKVYESKEGVA